MRIIHRYSFQTVCLTLAMLLQITFHVHAEGLVITDKKGRKVMVTDASRIVSIGGSVTEIIYALGEQDRIIARDSTSIFPREALTKQDVGYMRALSSEGVLSVRPTLVLALEGSGPPEVIEVLEKASIPFITVPQKFSEQGIIEKIELIGRIIGVPEKSRRLAENVRQDFAELKKITQSLQTKKKIMFILSMKGGNVLASGSNTAASALIDLAGADNAITGLEGYKPIASEAIIRSGPDAILMMDRTGDHAISTEDLFRISSFQATPAARSKTVIRMNGLFLLGFGPRTATAARELVKQLYGNGDRGD